MDEYTVYPDLTYDHTDGWDDWRDAMRMIIAELDPAQDGLDEDDVYLVRFNEYTTGVGRVYAWIGDETPFLFEVDAVSDKDCLTL